MYTNLIAAIDGATATTTSAAINVEGAEKVTMLCTRSNHSAGSTAFSATGSIDGTNFFALPLVVQAATTNAQTITRTVAPSLSSNTSVWLSVDMEYLALKQIKVTATETTDGTHDVDVLIQWP